MSTTTRPMTAGELFVLPGDGMRHELIKGQLTTMNPAGSEHGLVIDNIWWQLSLFVRSHSAGRLFAAETGFVLAHDPDTVRAPDVAFIRQARIDAEGVPKTFYPGAPDLAVEVLSPNDRPGEVERKVQDWLTNGTQLVWVVDPAVRTVTIHQQANESIMLAEDVTLTGEPLLPGFTCSVAEIFTV
jgi:Uma2 family endonuclease